MVKTTHLLHSPDLKKKPLPIQLPVFLKTACGPQTRRQDPQLSLEPSLEPLQTSATQGFVRVNSVEDWRLFFAFPRRCHPDFYRPKFFHISNRGCSGERSAGGLRSARRLWSRTWTGCWASHSRACAARRVELWGWLWGGRWTRCFLDRAPLFFGLLQLFPHSEMQSVFA